MHPPRASPPCSFYPRCDLDRQCYCQSDEHCADGYKCVNSKAFPEFKACKPWSMA
jgi:hypothetical protein